MSKMDKINNIAFDLMNEQVDEFTLFEKLKDIHELSLQTQLNDNQQIVLEQLCLIYIKQIYNSPIHAVYIFIKNGMSDAYLNLSNEEEIQVLEAFSKWASEQEDETE